MDSGKVKILLQLNNNTNQIQNVSLFDSTNNVDNPILPQTLFTFDITPIIIITDTVRVLVVLYSVNNGTFTTVYSTSATNLTTPQQVCDSLNTLNLVNFFVVGGNIIGYYSATAIVSSITGAYQTYPTQHNPIIYSNTGGSLLYNTGYSTNGVGTFTLLPSNTFWKNITPSYTQGRMNNVETLTAIVVTPSDKGGYLYLPITNEVANIYVAFSFTLRYYTTTPKVDIYANSTLVLSTNDSAMQTNINTALSGSFTHVQQTFWHIFPITLPIGNNVICVHISQIGVEGSNITDTGVEIYENTAAEITAATSTSQLNILNSTLNIPYYFAQY